MLTLQSFMTRCLMLLSVLFLPAVAFAQNMPMDRRDTNPGVFGLVLLGLIFFAGLCFIYFRRVSSDRHRRGQG